MHVPSPCHTFTHKFHFQEHALAKTLHVLLSITIHTLNMMQGQDPVETDEPQSNVTTLP